MESKDTEKTPAVSSKSFMALGPTLHYSHENVLICWFLAVTVFALSCLFWSKIATGQFASFTPESVTSLDAWRLDQFALTGVSIFEYPWQILVLGLSMGILVAAPILVAQLMSFSHSLPFIMAVFCLASLPGFGISLFISCLGVACRPLRFRSRIIAIALCMSPQLLYWGYFGGTRGSEPLVWGFSFAPWVCAWLVGLLLAGVVLAIGHFTRYKPGLVWSSTGIVLMLALGIFEAKIGFDELDFQLYVAKNNPELVSVFHDHSIRESLDQVIRDEKDYLDKSPFYRGDAIEQRKILKQEILINLGYGTWPGWFEPSEQLNYQDKTVWLNHQYDQFIRPAQSWWMPDFLYKQVLKRRSTSRRMAVTLYYKALLSEYNPDIALLKEKEVLHFYNDYPFRRSWQTWYSLYTDFSRSPESLEARWRIAWHWAAQGAFSRAQELLRDTEKLLAQRIAALDRETSETETIFRLFHPPAESIMTRVKLDELLYRVDRLQILISPENQTEGAASAARLAEFIGLDPHVEGYRRKLDALLEQLGETDGLRDNVLLAKAKFTTPDELRREEKLTALHHNFQNSDAGVEALYELGLLKIRLYQAESDASKKKRLLTEARDTLAGFMELYADTPYADQVDRNLTSLPDVQ